jgi:hypothetical protein
LADQRSVFLLPANEVALLPVEYLAVRMETVLKQPPTAQPVEAGAILGGAATAYPALPDALTQNIGRRQNGLTTFWPSIGLIRVDYKSAITAAHVVYLRTTYVSSVFGYEIPNARRTHQWEDKLISWRPLRWAGSSR